MRRLRKQLVHPACVAAANRRRDILRRIPQVDRVDVRLASQAHQTRTQREDAPPVRGRALGEDADDAARVLGDEVGEGDQVCRGSGVERGRCEGEEDGAEQGDALDEAGGGVGAGEDGLEDAGEVEGVEGGGEGGGDHGPGVGEVVLCC